MDKKKADEMILALQRKEVFGKKSWQGMNSEVSKKVIKLVYKKGKFFRRGDVEDNPSIKQVIPYVVFKYRNKYQFNAI